MKFNIPGKTYLVGEYAVLLGGSALGLSTDPSFSFEIGADIQSTVHPDSPAGRYLHKNDRQFVNGQLYDPYRIGGFGRSTAEYWSALLPDLIQKPANLSEILDQYKSLHSGSGVDLAFQYLGEISHVHTAEGIFERLNWPFGNLNFYIVSTGVKINTHEHISEINMNHLKELPEISSDVVTSFKSGNESQFLNQMNRWTNKLSELGLTHPNSSSLKTRLEYFDEIKLVKPCGALGADVLLVFFDDQFAEIVKNILNQQDLQILASAVNLAVGIERQIFGYQNLNSGVDHVD